MAQRVGFLFRGKATAVATCHRHVAKSRLSNPSVIWIIAPPIGGAIIHGAAGGIRTHGTVASTTDFESFQPLWLLWFFCIAFRLFCPPETIAVSRCFGIHPWKKLDFSRGSNESQKWADFGSFVRIRVRNVRTMLEQHSIHRRLPPNKWQRCMLWKSMTLIGRKCRIFLLRNRCACFAIAANEQRSIIWKAESCRAFIRGRKPGATKSGKKIWWLS